MTLLLFALLALGVQDEKDSKLEKSLDGRLRRLQWELTREISESVSAGESVSSCTRRIEKR